ncbi:hypothetical protein [Pedobacter sp. SL55]|uniref:hypothetical protein n=1 Tax=Pedobacter sp. SL55 TaxID=2995161 RepID=UPI002271FDF2|nr:hypothetical protein [Pedobacter sp. SL55]WAC41962.1 hypothetical protein OVA16_06280 [Pedobacter sp. SL55]
MMQKIIYGLVAAFFTFSTAAIASKKIIGSKIDPIKVEVRKTEKGFELIRGGKPYFIKGAGGTSYFSRLAAYGGNSIRTWSTNNAKSILELGAKKRTYGDDGIARYSRTPWF